MTLAPDALALVRELLPNAAGALFLTTHEGRAHAKFHEHAPESFNRMCVAAADGQFNDPDEPTFEWLYRANAPKVGQLLAPPPNYFKSNVYQLLIRGSGYHHVLDARLEVDGQRLGMLGLFRESGVGFAADEAGDLGRVALYFEHALRASRPAWAAEDRAVESEAMVVADTRGEVLLASPAALDLLNAIPLVGAHWPDRRRLPPVCLRLVDILRNDADYPLRMPAATIPFPGGALEIRAQWLGAPLEGNARDGNTDTLRTLATEGLVGIALTRTTPMSLRIWRNLGTAMLSPTQMEVAYWMALGGGREAARARMSISEAVLRDCVKAIYEKLGCSSQADLVDVLRATPGDREARGARALVGAEY